MISLWISEPTLTALDATAHHLGLTRSALIREALAQRLCRDMTEPPVPNGSKAQPGAQRKPRPADAIPRGEAIVEDVRSFREELLRG
jgi:hypothetical protein